MKDKDSLVSGRWWVRARVGIKAMVNLNILTEADLPNGAQGIITDIVLGHREHLDKAKIETGIITLRKVF